MPKPNRFNERPIGARGPTTRPTPRNPRSTRLTINERALGMRQGEQALREVIAANERAVRDLLRGGGVVLDGHARAEAASLLGIPIVVDPALGPDEMRVVQPNTSISTGPDLTATQVQAQMDRVYRDMRALSVNVVNNAAPATQVQMDSLRERLRTFRLPGFAPYGRPIQNPRSMAQAVSETARVRLPFEIDFSAAEARAMADVGGSTLDIIREAQRGVVNRMVREMEHEMLYGTPNRGPEIHYAEFTTPATDYPRNSPLVRINRNAGEDWPNAEARYTLERVAASLDMGPGAFPAGLDVPRLEFQDLCRVTVLIPVLTPRTVSILRACWIDHFDCRGASGQGMVRASVDEWLRANVPSYPGNGTRLGGAIRTLSDMREFLAFAPRLPSARIEGMFLLGRAGTVERHTVMTSNTLSFRGVTRTYEEVQRLYAQLLDCHASDYEPRPDVSWRTTTGGQAFIQATEELRRLGASIELVTQTMRELRSTMGTVPLSEVNTFLEEMRNRPHKDAGKALPLARMRRSAVGLRTDQIRQADGSLKAVPVDGPAPREPRKSGISFRKGKKP